MNDSLKTLQILLGDLSQVFANAWWKISNIAMIEPAIAVKSRIKADHVVPSFQQ
jgi:hypothetical protein